MILAVWIIVGFLLSFNAYAEESEMIKADRRALAEAIASGSSSRIIAAKAQLSDDLSLEAEQRRKDQEGVKIPLISDGHGHLMANVLINGHVPALLIVDTGSPVVMLNASFVEKLGVDLSQSPKGYVEILDGKYEAAAVALNSVQVGDMKAQDITTAVLLKENKKVGDGLLGLSFLNKFHFTLDHKGQKLILRKESGN